MALAAFLCSTVAFSLGDQTAFWVEELELLPVTLESPSFSLLNDSIRTEIEEDWLRSSVLERFEIGLTSKLWKTDRGRTVYLLVTYSLTSAYLQLRECFLGQLLLKKIAEHTHCR